MNTDALVFPSGQEFLKEFGQLGRNFVVNNGVGGFLVPNFDELLMTPAQRFLKSGLNVASLRTNATLDYDQWKQIDQTVMEVAQPLLVCAGDLMTGGLTHRMNSLGMMLSQYSRVSDMGPASVNMSVRTATDRDAVNFDQVIVPIPVICKEFSLDIRQIQAAKDGHESLDMTSARAAARSVARAIESMVILGSSVNVDGNGIPGYTNFTDRNSVTTSADWGTVANVESSVREMIAALYADNHYGNPGFMLYVNPEQYVQALAPTSAATPNRTALDLVKAMPDIIDVKKASYVPAGTAIMVEMNRDNVDLATTQDITTISWEERGGWVLNFMVVAVMAPRVKSDIDGHSGICTHTNI